MPSRQVKNNTKKKKTTDTQEECLKRGQNPNTRKKKTGSRKVEELCPLWRKKKIIHVLLGFLE